MKKSVLDYWQFGKAWFSSQGRRSHRSALPKSAFTLAEVLIVLGVIGVVAALTIPTLLKNWQEDRWDIAAKVFENRLTQAVGQMHARQRLTGYTTTEAFVNDLKNFMKVTDCANCVIDGINVGDSSAKFNKSWGTNIVGQTVVNGANMLIAYNPSCNLDPAANSVEAAECSVAVVYDTNGTSEPNMLDKDVRYFNVALLREGASCMDDRGITFGNLCLSKTVEPKVSINTCDGSSEWDVNCTTAKNCSECANNSWAAGKRACAEKTPAGRWRLPSDAELVTLDNNAQASYGFPGGSMFTSTEYTHLGNQHYVVFRLLVLKDYFTGAHECGYYNGDGHCSYLRKDSAQGQVFCVTDLQ